MMRCSGQVLTNFFFVTEKILFHFSSKKYESVPVVVLANVLLSHYAKAVEIVVSTNVSTQTHSQHETTPQPIPFSPSLPDITTKQPTKAYSARSYTLFFVQDVSPIGGGDFIKYKYVLALVDRDIKMPLCYVT